MRMLRASMRMVALTGAMAAMLAPAVPLSVLAIPDLADAAGENAQAVVSQEAVTSAPYDLAIAPDGEFRILHFDAGLVTSVLVAKPWLLTVLIQGNDVVLQAKATAGETQLVAYVGSVGTLWRATISSHGQAPTRIVVRAPGEQPVMAVTPPLSQATAPPALSPSKAQDPRLAAFVRGLSPDQRAAFEAWRKDPSAPGLEEWLAGLSTPRRAAFNLLVSAGVISVKPVLPMAGTRPAVPQIMDTTTVIGEQPAPAGPESSANSRMSGSSVSAQTSATPPDAIVQGLPAGVTVTASAALVGGNVEIRYTIHNGLKVGLTRARVTATDGLGHAAAMTGAPAGSIVPGRDLSGTLVVHATSLPIVTQWAFEPHRAPQGTVQFAIAVS